jgi:uncharacterized protein YkwD
MPESDAKVRFMPKRNHIYSAFAVVFVAFALVPAAGAGTSASTVSSLLAAVNKTRSAHGLRPLTIDLRLTRAAKAHAVEMLQGNYFSHGDFHSRMVAFHVRGPQAGENLAWGNGSYGEPAGIIAGWLASPGHRANLLRPGWTRIGIGLARGTFLGNGDSTVVTADFAGR